MLSALKKPVPDPFIAKHQMALAKSFKTWTNAKSISDASQLAWYLVGGNQSAVARSLVDEVVDNVQFTGNQNLWSAAARSICMASRLAREAKDTKRSKALLARIVKTPAYANKTPRPVFEDILEGSLLCLENAKSEKTGARACKLAAFALDRLVYFAETARHGGFAYDAYFKPAEIDRRIADGVKLLRERLPRS